MQRGASNFRYRQKHLPSINQDGTHLDPLAARRVTLSSMKLEETQRNQPENSATQTEKPSEHHSVYCPNCSYRLTGHRCKLICQRCGYYLSCADYY
jgi:hypothetical protein